MTFEGARADGTETMILILDTEFTDVAPDMELLSLALVSTDGRHEFYGERNDVPVDRCSRFVREAVLPLMDAKAPVSGDLSNLCSRLRTFLDGLPEAATLACDSGYDVQLFCEAIGEPWPERLRRERIDLSMWTALPVFAEAQALYHEMGHPYHHALNDVRALRAGYQAWLVTQQ
jgi:hypothetical protein